MTGAGVRLIAILEILLVSGILTQSVAASILSAAGRLDTSTLPGLFLFMAADALLLCGLIALLQRRRGGWVRPFGLRPAGLTREIYWGVGLGFAFFALLVLGSDWFFSRFLPSLYTPQNPILSLLKSPLDMMFLLGSGIVGGGVREELQRAFIIRRLETLSRRRTSPQGRDTGEAVETPAIHPWGIWTGLAFWSILFGYGHRVQGPDAVVTTIIAGFLLGCIFLWRRSIYAPVICHSLSNSLTIVTVYYFP